MLRNVISSDRPQSREGLTNSTRVCAHEPVEKPRHEHMGCRRPIESPDRMYNNSLQRLGTIKCTSRGRAMQVGRPACARGARRPAAELGR
jgi:hypothetical protein